MLPRVHLRGLVLGAGLGLLWFGVLLIPESSRQDLTGGSDRSPGRMLLLLVVVSSLMTWVLPFSWLRARSRAKLLAGLLLPLVGALAFASLVFAADPWPSLPDLIVVKAENSQGPILDFLGGLAGLLLMFVIGVPAMVLAHYTSAFYVVIPMGLLHVELATRSSPERMRSIEAPTYPGV